YLRGMSAEEFFRFCQDNPKLRLERDAKGEIIFISPSGFQSSNLSHEIAYELESWNRVHKYGKATDSNGGFTLPNGAIRAADVALVSFARLKNLPQEELKKFPAVTPNFIVEVISPSDSLADQQAKMDEWIQNGVELGWLICPQTEQVWIYEPSKATVHHTGFDRSLSGELALPGFTFDLKLLRG
ncbi:MAG TPA: hypothetical protein DCP28_36285, partial [Cytophagales bacterium]|nr:hypothetical protein [Cytophagales bacterium]